MKTPDKICLIDTGDGIDWCDSVPSNDIPDESVVWYTRTDPLAENPEYAICCLGADHKCQLNVNGGYCAATRCQYRVFNNYQKVTP